LDENLNLIEFFDTQNCENQDDAMAGLETSLKAISGCKSRKSEENLVDYAKEQLDTELRVS
jgi:hypothetical protein